MMRIATLFASLLLSLAQQAQTYFYIDQINVVPNPATTSDDVQVQLIGNLSSSGSYIVSAQASVTGNLVSLTVVAASTGGLTVLVPHTETINLGQLPAGDYSTVFTLNSFGILLTGPAGQGDFTVLGGGDPCDLVDIVSVRWHAFSDTAIVVHVVNNSTDIFSYPNFILLDAVGDTLAKETVNFSGIAEESWHFLRVLDGTGMPSAPFVGTLELWTLFTEDLACSWSLNIDLCPPEPCATFMPSLGNYGGALVLGTFNWEVFNDDGTVAAGQFLMTETEQYVSETLCLPPGEYEMLVSPTGPPTGGAAMFFATDESGYGTELWPVAWSLPVALPVHFYAPCIDGTNGLPEARPSAWTAQPTADGVLIRSVGPDRIGPVRVLDCMGRVVAVASMSTNELFLPCASTGLLVVQADGRSVKLIR